MLVFASTDAARPILNGINVKTEKNALMLAGTDGFGLILAEAVAEDGVTPCTDFTITYDSAKAVIKALPRAKARGRELVTLKGDSTNPLRGCVEFDDGSTPIEMIVGTYPSYRQLIPTEQPDDADASIALGVELLAKLAKAGKPGHDDHPRIKIWVNGHSSPIVAKGDNWLAVIMPMFCQWESMADEVKRFLCEVAPASVAAAS